MYVRILAAGIACAIAMLLLGWLIWGILLHGYFDSTMTATAKSVMNTEPSFAPLVVAEIVFGLLFAFIFDYWASISTFVGGLAGGAILMFGLSLGWDLQMSAFFKDMHVGSPYIPMVVDIIAATVMGAISGGVIGQVLGMMKKG